MRLLLTLRTARAVRLATAALGLLFVSNCTKMEEQPTPAVRTNAASQPVKPADIRLLQQQFRDKGYAKQLNQPPTGQEKAKDAWTWTPLWNEAFQKTTADAAADIYIPLEPRQQVEPYKITLVGAKRYLLIKRRGDQLDFSVATYIYPEPQGDERKAATLSSDPSLSAPFSGTLVLNHLATGEEDHLIYQNGITPQQSTNKSVIASPADNTGSSTNDCYYYYTCYWSGYCASQGSTVGTITTGRFCLEPSFVPGCGGSVSLTLIEQTSVFKCDAPNPGTDPPIGGGGSRVPLHFPCPGDVINNPTIAPSSPGNYAGGLYGNTRNGGTKFHDGVDIEAAPGAPLISMHTGVVTAIRSSFSPGQLQKKSYGNFVEVQSIINGNVVYIKYNHLDGIAPGLVIGSEIVQGGNIGISGRTGNAAGKRIIPHVHIQAKNANRQSTDPQEYIRTKFNQATGTGVRPC